MSIPLDPRVAMVRIFVSISLACALLGCGKQSSSTTPEPVVPASTVPETPVAVHEMDPAKQVLPSEPAAGMIGGRAFQPDRATFEGQTLIFRQTSAASDVQVSLFFVDYRSNEPLKLSVLPTQKLQGSNIPSVQISQKRGDDPAGVVILGDGYALTLELSPRKDGKIAGRIHLSLPGDEKNFLAGSFAATYERELNDPPEPEDRPYIAGKIAHEGKPNQSLRVQYAGLPADGGDLLFDSASSKLGQGPFFATRTTSYAPRALGLRSGKSGGEEYDGSRLPPGKYFLVARIDDGPAVWKVIDVKADSALDAPLTIPPGVCGSAEVTVPAGSAGQVQALPVELKIDDPSGTFTTAASGALGSFANVADGKASLKNLTPGKYVVSLRTGTAILRSEVDIAPGRTARVELK